MILLDGSITIFSFFRVLDFGNCLLFTYKPADQLFVWWDEGFKAASKNKKRRPAFEMINICTEFRTCVDQHTAHTAARSSPKYNDKHYNNKNNNKKNQSVFCCCVALVSVCSLMVMMTTVIVKLFSTNFLISIRNLL